MNQDIGGNFVKGKTSLVFCTYQYTGWGMHSARCCLNIPNESYQRSLLDF